MIGSVLEINVEFGLVYDKSMMSTPSRETREVVVVWLLLVRLFAVRVTKHITIRILQQSAVTG